MKTKSKLSKSKAPAAGRTEGSQQRVVRSRGAKDQNGYELKVGDPVLCDGEAGKVVDFGGVGLGIWVLMEADKARIDWPSEQVEYDS